MFDPLLEGWKARALSGFVGLVGPLWTKNEDESWAYGLLADQKHANPAGLVHGGMLSTLLDHTLSVIAWEANQRRPCITVALDVQFVAAVRPGDFVIARGNIVRQTASLVFAQGYLAVDEQKVATATAILKIR